MHGVILVGQECFDGWPWNADDTLAPYGPEYLKGLPRPGPHTSVHRSTAPTKD